VSLLSWDRGLGGTRRRSSAARSRATLQCYDGLCEIILNYICLFDVNDLFIGPFLPHHARGFYTSAHERDTGRRDRRQRFVNRLGSLQLPRYCVRDDSLSALCKVTL
jgi:hypothetical protein